jgi:hypothetical protein
VSEKKPIAWKIINDEIERLMPLHRSADGVMNDDGIAVDLGEFVRSNLARLVDPNSYAREKLAQYQESRSMFKRTRGGGLQLAIPNLDAIVQLGNNTSVLLRDARRAHLTQRREMLRDQSQAQQVAFVREITVIETALDRLTSDADTFGDVMGKDYGPAEDAAGS